MFSENDEPHTCDMFFHITDVWFLCLCSTLYLQGFQFFQVQFNYRGFIGMQSTQNGTYHTLRKCCMIKRNCSLRVLFITKLLVKWVMSSMTSRNMCRIILLIRWIFLYQELSVCYCYMVSKYLNDIYLATAVLQCLSFLPLLNFWTLLLFSCLVEVGARRQFFNNWCIFSRSSCTCFSLKFLKCYSSSYRKSIANYLKCR